MKTLLAAAAVAASLAAQGAAAQPHYATGPAPQQPQGYGYAAPGYGAPGYGAPGYGAPQPGTGYQVRQPQSPQGAPVYGPPPGYAQGPGSPQGAGFPQGPQGPAAGASNVDQNGNYRIQFPGHTGTAGVSPQIATLLTSGTWRAIKGEIMTFGDYLPDGRCAATVGGRTGGFSMQTQACNYTARDAGPNRIQLTVTLMLQGKTLTDQSTLRLGKGGTLFDETQRVKLVRINRR